MQEKGIKPKLLLHACCAPCACFPLEFLKDAFEITILYNNSNIYPYSEYHRRLDELKRYLHQLNTTLSTPIQLIETEYQNLDYTKKLAPLKDEPERGKRCLLCYRLRMQEGFSYAVEHHFDYYTTVMTISRQKDSQVLNQMGAELQSLYPQVTYFHSDFKKNNGILKANELIQAHELYRQDYCGCVYSIPQKERK